MDVKKLAGLLYDMGTVFDDFKGTRMSTEEFLRTGNTDVLSTVQNRDLMLDLKECSRIALEYDYDHLPFDHTLLQAINSGITRTASLWPGKIRDNENIGVNTIYGEQYIPPIPDVDAVDNIMKECDSEANDNISMSASICFAMLAKMQPFWDGNKRTALLAANGLLLKHGIDNEYFTVPSGSKSVEFNEKLSDYYLDRNDEIINWLSDFNEDKSGLNEIHSLEGNSSPPSKNNSNQDQNKSGYHTDITVSTEFNHKAIHVRSYDRNGIHVHNHYRVKE
jgi:prophage maintenance system killer protein